MLKCLQIVGILTFMSMINFVLSLVEHEKVLSTLGQLPLSLRDDFKTRIDTGHKTRTKHMGASKGEGTCLDTPEKAQVACYMFPLKYWFRSPREAKGGPMAS